MNVGRGWWWLAALAWLLLPAMASAGDGRAPLGVYLEVETNPKSVPATHPSSSAAMLVLNSMAEPRRELLAHALDRLVAVVNRKKNPFFVSLDDSEERKAVEDLIAQTAPAFTAATTLAAGNWPSPEGDLLIRPVARCAAARPCVRLGTAPDADESERRARFLAWPLGYAILIAVEGRAELDKVAEALRAPGSFQIGLVLTSAELHSLRASHALSALKQHTRRLVKAMPKSRTGLSATLANLARAGLGKDGLAWLKFPSDTILVVPRLGALATPDRFVADVRRRLAAIASKVDWLASPQ